MEWTPIKKSLPPSTGMYIIFSPPSLVTVSWWMNDTKEWNLILATLANSITHWMDLPQPPSCEKGVRK